MIKLIYEGLSIENGKVIYNSEKDNPNDIMNILNPDIYESEFGGNIYCFGYSFNNNASRKDRTTIIHWLKNLDNEGIDEGTLIKFIDKPLRFFDKKFNLMSFDIMLSPKSGRSELMKIILHEVHEFTSHECEKRSFELVKSIPKDVMFDWNQFNDDYEGEIGDNQYNQIHNYIEDTLMPKIHDLTYFSIADSVKYKYRKYIQNYLNISKEAKETIEAIQSGKILIIDDINTSGSTLHEILRITRSINPKCEIYIFTLIGR